MDLSPWIHHIDLAFLFIRLLPAPLTTHGKGCQVFLLLFLIPIECL